MKQVQEIEVVRQAVFAHAHELNRELRSFRDSMNAKKFRTREARAVWQDFRNRIASMVSEACGLSKKRILAVFPSGGFPSFDDPLYASKKAAQRFLGD